MIRAVLGFILLILALLNYSTLYSLNQTFTYDIKRVILYRLLFLLTLVFQSSLGLATYFFNLNVFYHAYVGYSIFLLICIIINLNVLNYFAVNRMLSIRKACFEALIYTIVLVDLAFKIHTYVPRWVSITVISILTVILLFLIVYSIGYSKKLFVLVDYVDLTKSAKAFTFSSALFGCGSIVLDLRRNVACTITVVVMLSFLITYLVAFVELVNKYIKPLKDVQ